MRRSLGVALALAIAVLGCEPADPVAPRSDEGPPQVFDPSEGLPALPAGTVRVEIVGDRLSFEAFDAPRGEVLRELAAATGMVLEGVAAGAPERRITGRIADAALVDVLALVLRGVDFSVQMAFDPTLQRHRVAVLRFGEAPAEPEPLAAALFELLDSDDPEVVLTALEVIERAGDPVAVPEIEPLLDDEDAEVREAAAAVLDELSLGDLEAQGPDL